MLMLMLMLTLILNLILLLCYYSRRFWPSVQALRSLRQLSAGLGTEPAVFQAAAGVPALGAAGLGLGFRV